MNDVALRADSLNLISICAGGGGLDLGVELALPSARAVCLVEREAFSASSLVAAIEDGLMAPAAVWSDAKTFRGREWRGCVDGLIGGIPCQPHSVAGKRQGEKDPRDLWSSARRILVQSGAWWILVENVGGMLTASEDGVDPGAYRVWRDLQRLGFQVEGGLFTAEEIGAPHQRERVFLLGVADARCDGQFRRAELHRWSVQPGEQTSQRDHAERRNSPLADGLGLGQQRLRPNCQAQRWKNARRPAGLCGRATLVNAGSGGCSRWEEDEVGLALRRAAAQRPSGTPLFPPRPDQLEHWRDVLKLWPQAEPAVRGMADGLAHRVDRLRMLGNGVVPLQAAYALRTLATRLAARSSGAAELVRLMGDA